MMEIMVVCPSCRTEINVGIEDVGLFIIHCLGCDNKIVIHEGAVYTVTEKFMKELMEEFDFKVCGGVLAEKLSAQASKRYESKKYDKMNEELNDLLSKDMDVSEFLKKIQ